MTGRSPASFPAAPAEEDVLRLASGGVVEPAEPDHLHGIPALVNDPHVNPVIRQNIEKVVPDA